MILKGTVGTCACMGGTLGFVWSTVAILFTIESYVGLFTALLTGTVAAIIAAASVAITTIIPYGVICGFGICGAAMLGWAASDYVSGPEAPLPEAPQHLIEVVPAEGSPKLYRLPARVPPPMAH